MPKGEGDNVCEYSESHTNFFCFYVTQSIMFINNTIIWVLTLLMLTKLFSKFFNGKNVSIILLLSMLLAPVKPVVAYKQHDPNFFNKSGKI